MKYLILFVAMLCAHLVQGITDDEMKAAFVKIAMKCSKENPVDVSELFKLQKLIPPEKTEVKCLLACTYKREGLMTNNGLIDIEHGYELAELMKSDDEQRLANAKKVVDICAKVNEAEVSDGEKGCERATLLFKCLVENYPKYGFKM